MFPERLGVITRGHSPIPQGRGNTAFGWRLGEDDDYAQVYAGMTKCSNYAHDKALVGGIAIPEPDELQLNDNLTYVPQNPGLGSSSSLLPLHLAPLRNFSIK